MSRRIVISETPLGGELGDVDRLALGHLLQDPVTSVDG